jgi:hypothetical protein
MNFYRYVRNSPIGLVDPFGLREYPDSFIGPLQPGDYRTRDMTATKCGRVPPHPSWVDIDRNIGEAGRHWSPWWFRDQVKPGGPWDTKQFDTSYTDFGNYNYGAAGTGFGFPENILLREAGRANKSPGSTGDPGSRWNPWGGTPPYGDQPEDQEQIKKGIGYCRCVLGLD